VDAKPGGRCRARLAQHPGPGVYAKLGIRSRTQLAAPRPSGV